MCYVCVRRGLTKTRMRSHVPKEPELKSHSAFPISSCRLSLRPLRLSLSAMAAWKRQSPLTGDIQSFGFVRATRSSLKLSIWSSSHPAGLCSSNSRIAPEARPTHYSNSKKDTRLSQYPLRTVHHAPAFITGLSDSPSLENVNAVPCSVPQTIPSRWNSTFD